MSGRMRVSGYFLFLGMKKGAKDRKSQEGTTFK